MITNEAVRRKSESRRENSSWTDPPTFCARTRTMTKRLLDDGGSLNWFSASTADVASKFTDTTVSANPSSVMIVVPAWAGCIRPVPAGTVVWVGVGVGVGVGMAVGGIGVGVGVGVAVGGTGASVGVGVAVGGTGASVGVGVAVGGTGVGVGVGVAVGGTGVSVGVGVGPIGSQAMTNSPIVRITPNFRILGGMLALISQIITETGLRGFGPLLILLHIPTPHHHSWPIIPSSTIPVSDGPNPSMSPNPQWPRHSLPRESLFNCNPPERIARQI